MDRQCCPGGKPTRETQSGGFPTENRKNTFRKYGFEKNFFGKYTFGKYIYLPSGVGASDTRTVKKWKY